MFTKLPPDAKNLLSWRWPEIEPYYRDLKERPLSAGNLDRWMADWSRIYSLVDEVYSRLYVASTANTADQEMKKLFDDFLDNVQPRFKAEEQALKEKILDSDLCPTECDLLLKKMRTEAEIYREENLPLLSQEQKMRQRFSSITGSQTVVWQGQERTIAQLRPVYQEQDRSLRQKAWEVAAQRQLQDRSAMAELWQEYFNLRRRIANNVGFHSFRDYRWRSLHRYDYTPEDCQIFRKAIEKVVVPAAQRIYQKRQEALGLDSLRPWDLDVDVKKRPPLKAFSNMSQLISGVSGIFHKLDVELAGYFDLMASEDLLDLENRKNKRPGGYCITFNAAKRPFIFANAVGTHGDVQTLIHESGHAFHAFISSRFLPYAQQTEGPMEFNEVASMAMELLAGSHLEAFYSKEDAERAFVEHLEGIVLFWPYMAVVDGFQHWAYENPEMAMDPQACDEKWDELHRRFMKGIDYTGYEEFRRTGWQRRLHIYIHPFYYVEYGLAQLGALQVWANSLRDPGGALQAYKKALAMGGTRPLPELYKTGGASLTFDSEVLGQAMELIEKRLGI